ncbi:hypothetical protein MKZ38_004297 [Zalerion maritima]|uniref:Golgi apparatus membrane protein TVP18 n=1 Tax=Zalerion maritima TaxID=339359 RepID=A0AAD5WQ05_9PEZI|nr:hypothetical protein MKZ38_004297 [Zalerion maritima]
MPSMQGIKEEFATRNFSIYAQWLGILSMILCFALGISNIVTSLLDPFNLILAIFSLCFSFVILFIEVPFLLRICPTSTSFDNFIRKITTNFMRAASYIIMAVVLWLAIITKSGLIAAAVFLTFTALCYLIAALKGQSFVGSKTLGGQGVAQMIV